MSDNDHHSQQQGRSRDLILSTNEEVSTEPQQQPPKESKKKKSRGNRKLQRFRAKLKKQGLNTETITTLINGYNHPSRQEHENIAAPSTTKAASVPRSSSLDVHMEQFIELPQEEPQGKHQMVQEIKTKRKRDTTRPTGVPTSISTISIVQPSTKRQRPSTTTGFNVVQSQSINESRSNIQPSYLKISDHIFKNMLLTALEGAENTIELLSTQEKLQYARDYAQLINDLFYLRLKQDFWDNYYKVAIQTGIWSLNMSKQMMKENHFYSIQFRTENNIQKQRQRVIEELKEIEIKVDQHKQLAIHFNRDINKLSSMIPAFVRKCQHKLMVDFERRKLLLEYNLRDYRLVQSFYDLKPTEDQMNSAKIIWQATIDKQYNEEYIAILKQRIYTKRLPSSFQLLDHSIDNIEKILTQPTFPKDSSATLLSERQKLIAKYKYDMIELTIRSTEELIRNHINIIVNEKKKLIDLAGGQHPLPKPLVTILNTIKERQSNIIKRGQIITQQKISFFDNAPMVMISETENKETMATIGAKNH